MTSTPARFAQIWNRKLHIYLGLYFTVFLWLFAVSGLLLNHSSWRFTEFWNNRRQSTTERPIDPPPDGDDLARARELMRQLALSGEVEWTNTRPTAERFDFKVVRPGRNTEVSADLRRKVATLQEIQFNIWGVLRTSHTFTGVQSYSTRPERDWYLTKLWSFSMDAVATGMIFLVLSSAWLAWERKEKWVGSAIAFVIGLAACGFFVFGLRWF